MTHAVTHAHPRHPENLGERAGYEYIGSTTDEIHHRGIFGLIGQFVVCLINHNRHLYTHLTAEGSQFITVDRHARGVIGIAQINQTDRVIDRSSHCLQVNAHIVP